MTLIDEATTSGARVERACAVLGLSMRTLERWRLDDAGDDQRHGPAAVDHALTAHERERALQLANSPEYRDLPAEQVIARLADRGIYVCSERSLERLQHEHDQHRHRERSRAPEHVKPREYVANGPNQVMTWDITYLPGPVRGQYFYLYLFLDIWSRRIMGAQVLDIEDSKLAAELLTSICDAHQLQQCDVVLHSDNGAAMKGSTMLTTMRWLGIRASFSRPGVSDDNAHVEALFRTLKYRPSYPVRGFGSIEHARAWVEGFVRCTTTTTCTARSVSSRPTTATTAATSTSSNAARPSTALPNSATHDAGPPTSDAGIDHASCSSTQSEPHN